MSLWGLNEFIIFSIGSWELELVSEGVACCVEQCNYSNYS